MFWSFAEAKQFLESRCNFEQQRSWTLDGLEVHLAVLRRFLDFCGSPDKHYRIIHVAGTKGKGSVCAYFENILRSAGYSSGCFTSPHLYSFSERFRFNGVSCTEQDFAEVMYILKEQLEKASSEIKTEPHLTDYFTYFEITVLFAFLYFAAKNADAVILETGLGGRFDATNVCIPNLTVITNIGLEHTEQLGSTLAAIAGEKAGIIKTGIPVVSGVMNEEPQKIIRKIAAEKSAPLEEFGAAFTINPQGNNTFTFRNSGTVIENLCPAMPGIHQQHNAALAVEGLHLLRQSGVFRITDENICKGIAAATLPVRIEIIEQQDKPVLIFDGAHTKDSVSALLETVKTVYPEKNITVIFGVSSGKDIDGISDELMPVADRVIFTQHSSNARSVNPQELYEFIRQNKTQYLVKCSVISDGRTALDTAVKDITVKNTPEKEIICITGSLFLAAELSEHLRQ